MECPEAVERGRNFRLLAEEELSELLDFLAGYLPESLKFHQTVETYMRDKVWDFHFYVANDWPKSAICIHFPGMTLSPHGLLYESVGVFCPNDRLELLKLLREEDILIDWSRPLYINLIHHDIAEELIRLYGDTGSIETVVGDVCTCKDFENILQTEESEEEDDPDVQVMPLRPEHAEGIHELYPVNDMECHEVFLRLIGTLPAAGVFAKGKLAAWMIQSYYGAMFSMQTKPEYRRKGFGTKLARYLTKHVSERGYRPFVVIRPENEASQSLYRKLGFVKLYETVRMIFTPATWQDAENEASSILRDNLENAVRQLTVGKRVLDAFRNEEENGEVEETIVERVESSKLADKDVDKDKEEEEEEEEDEVRKEKQGEKEDEERPEGRINEVESSEKDTGMAQESAGEGQAAVENCDGEGDGGGCE
ncbi:hypothetical protein KM043_006302 [Ampulex compressa]|nr:hypothetical protein KM043_006302 [Ampulex compressa]